MNDIANLCAQLKAEDPKALEDVIPNFNVKELSRFVAFVRTGDYGSRGFCGITKRLIRQWLSNRTDDELFHDALERIEMPLGDIIGLIHPNPETPSRSAMYAWLRGAKFDGEALIEKIHYKGKDYVRVYAADILPPRLRDWLVMRNKPGYLSMRRNMA